MHCHCLKYMQLNLVELYPKQICYGAFPTSPGKKANYQPKEEGSCRSDYILKNILEYGKYENLHESDKLVLIKYFKYLSRIPQVRVQKFTPHNHIECTD